MPAYKRKPRCIFLGLQGHERGASFNMQTSNLHQIRMQACDTTPKKDETSSEGHSQRRAIETIGHGVHIYYIR